MKLFKIKKIIILIILALLCYSGYWLTISLILKSKITNNINHINGLMYDDIRISGFPYRIQTNIFDFEIVDFKKGDSFKIPEIYINMNPFDLQKILVRFEKLRLKISQEKTNIKSNMKEIKGLINLEENELKSISFLINGGSATVNNIKVIEINQTQFDILKIKKNTYEFNTNIKSANLPLIKQKDIEIELKGKSRINKKKINGNFQILAKKNNTKEKILEFPLKVKNNKVYMLFVPIFDLEKLFSFF